MRPSLVAFALTAMALGTLQTRSEARRELDNVAAFARLFGVVRYFYPSDTAAGLDWDRFAVEGVRQVRSARDLGSVETALENLVAALGPGIEIGEKFPPRPVPVKSDDKPVAWRYLGAGFERSGNSNMYSPYRGKRTNRSRPAGETIDGFVTLMQTIPAGPFAGKRVLLRGQVRATIQAASGSAALWLRVDRTGRQIGFFDNMNDRPVRDSEWREYVIEGPVADDATSVAFGIMATGAVAADFDAIQISVQHGDGTSTRVDISDAGFEESTSATARGWVRAGTSQQAEVTRPAGPAPQGRRFLRLSAPSLAGSAPAQELFDEAPPAAGEHIEIDLGLGLKARVPLVLSGVDAAAPATRSLPITFDRPGSSSPMDAAEPSERNIGLADVVVAWNVFRHFYPYWTEANVDWDTRLLPQLQIAYVATDHASYRDALRLLVADARDGHGGVTDARGSSPRSALPLRLGVFQGQVVVTASETTSPVPVGAVVSAIDGVPAMDRLTALMRLASGTPQWKQARALQEICICQPGSVVTLALDDADGRRASTLHCDATLLPAEKRPEPVAELKPGIWYVDMTRARMAQVTPRLPTLATATGVVFDVRGYPTDIGAGMLPHLISASETDRWMHIAKIVGPFGRSAGWHSVGWNLNPATPRLSGKIVFLTDERAISYAESVMGYVADRKLGTIVGSTTAGTNGNVATFVTPGGFRVSFTGMRVTGHDGRTPHHLVGIKPDVPVAPTIAGLRAGRDEVLERGVALIR